MCPAHIQMGSARGGPLTSRSSACDSTTSCWLSIFLLLQAVHYLICLFVYFNLLNFLVIYGDRMRWAKAEQEGSRGTNWFTHSFMYSFLPPINPHWIRASVDFRGLTVWLGSKTYKQANCSRMLANSSCTGFVRSTQIAQMRVWFTLQRLGLRAFWGSHTWPGT